MKRNQIFHFRNEKYQNFIFTNFFYLKTGNKTCPFPRLPVNLPISLLRLWILKNHTDSCQITKFKIKTVFSVFKVWY